MCFQALLLQQYGGPWSDVKDQEAPNALVLLAEEARDWAKTCRKAAGKQHLAASSSACIPESFCELFESTRVDPSGLDESGFSSAV